MQPTLKHYIQGRWETGVTLGVQRNPQDAADVVAEYARADALQAEQGARAATGARRSWAQSALPRRVDTLTLIGEALQARQEPLGRLLAREQGRAADAAKAEVRAAAQVFLGVARDLARLPVPGAQGVPLGAVALIGPSASPLLVPAWQIAPALAWGNTMVFKPAERGSACGWALAEIISRAGLPAGVFNLVMGSGRLVGQALVDSPQIDAISFSGSPAVAEPLRQRAQARGARLQLLPPRLADRPHGAAQAAFFNDTGPPPARRTALSSTRTTTGDMP